MGSRVRLAVGHVLFLLLSYVSKVANEKRSMRLRYAPTEGANQAPAFDTLQQKELIRHRPSIRGCPKRKDNCHAEPVEA